MRIFNMTNILAKQRGCNAILARNDATKMLAEYFGNNYMYCGWGNKRLGLETSPLANPYSHKSNARADRKSIASRDEAVEMYRKWLWARICADDKAVLASLSQVTPTTALICWCAPKRCHCEVISRAADWLRRETLPAISFTYEFIGYGLVSWDAHGVCGVCDFTTIEALKEEVYYCVSRS